jgi:uncharacterized membrane protein YcaP (DUF421 family)
LISIFGAGENLTALQMCARALAISGICLVLIRISGRRSFGQHMPIDNVISILLGAILSRAVVGASPAVAVIAAATTIAVAYRALTLLCYYSHFFGRLFKGEAKIVYENGKMNQENLRYCGISENDLIEGVRLEGHLNSFEKIESIYVERNGKISVIIKKLS